MEALEQEEIIRKINERASDALSKIYPAMYPELYYYSYSLYKETDNAKDAIQDAFLYLWEHPKIQFDSLQKLKSYLYVLIRNDFISSLRKSKTQKEHQDSYLYENDYYVYQAAEAEIFTIIPAALRMLPEECARILKLLLEGWNLKEVAEKLGMPTSTVHFQKQRAISILRAKLSKDKLLLLAFLLDGVV